MTCRFVRLETAAVRRRDADPAVTHVHATAPQSDRPGYNLSMSVGRRCYGTGSRNYYGATGRLTSQGVSCSIAVTLNRRPGSVRSSMATAN